MVASLDQHRTLIFGLLAVIYCAITAIDISLSVDWAIKILPVLVLLNATMLVFKTQPDKKLSYFILGLVFCMAGDIFLAVDRTNLFIFGLGSFLIGHLFFISALTPICKRNMAMLFVLLCYGMFMIALLTPNLGELLVPVIVYMLVLLVMAATCLTSDRTNLYLIIGGLSFTLSDSLLGLDKFYQTIPSADLWIMITYYLAQFYLTKGFLASLSGSKQ